MIMDVYDVHNSHCWLCMTKVLASLISSQQVTLLPHFNHMQQILQMVFLKLQSKLLSAAQHLMMCSLLKVLVSVPVPALPLKVRGLRSHHLAVDVANAHSLVILRVDAQNPSPQLALSHALT